MRGRTPDEEQEIVEKAADPDDPSKTDYTKIQGCLMDEHGSQVGSLNPTIQIN